MSDKFLGGNSSNLTNGTANLYIANLTIDNLDASMPVKTNSTKTLVSELLDIADVSGLQAILDAKLGNPMTADLDFQSFSANDINDIEFNKLASLSASTAGTIRLYASSVDSEIHMVDEAGVDTVIGEGSNPITQSTGVFVGGQITANIDTSLFDVEAGSGQIANPNTGVVVQVSWAEMLGNNGVYATLQTYVLIDVNGDIVKTGTKPSNSDLRDNILLGVLVSTDTVNIVAIAGEQSFLGSTLNQISDLASALGAINTAGNVMGPSTLLTVAKSTGSMYSFGANAWNDLKNPSNITTGALDTNVSDTFGYFYQDGSGSGPITDLIPGEFDDGNGQSSPGTVSSQRWQTQRVYLFPEGGIVILPGQQTYGNLIDAQSAVNTEPFNTLSNVASNGLLISYIFVRGGGTDLNTTPGDAEFLQASRLSGGSGDVAGGNVNGPVSSTINGLCKFSTTDGKTIKDNSGAILTDAGALTLSGDLVIDKTTPNIQLLDGAEKWDINLNAGGELLFKDKNDDIAFKMTSDGLGVFNEAFTLNSGLFAHFGDSVSYTQLRNAGSDVNLIQMGTSGGGITTLRMEQKANEAILRIGSTANGDIATFDPDTSITTLKQTEVNGDVSINSQNYNDDSIDETNDNSGFSGQQGRGFQFTISTQITITHFKIWQDKWVSGTTLRKMRIYDDVSALLHEANIDKLTPVGDWYETSVGPFVLAPGTYRTTCFIDGTAGDLSDFTARTYSPFLTVVNNTQGIVSGSDPTFPFTLSATNNGAIGQFRFVANVDHELNVAGSANIDNLLITDLSTFSGLADFAYDGLTTPTLWAETGILVGDNNSGLGAIQLIGTDAGTLGLRFGKQSDANRGGLLFDNSLNEIGITTEGVYRLTIDDTDIKMITDNFTIGTTSGGGGNQWTINSGRGSNGQFLTTDGVGGSSWTTGGAGFDQDLNTTDDVGFENIQLGTTSGAVAKGITMLFIANVDLLAGRVVKIVNDAGTAKVAYVAWNDNDAVGVVGVTVTGADADDDILVCIGGVFTATVEDTEFIQIGEMLEKSDTFDQDGRVLANPVGSGSPGIFGIALTSGTGDEDGTVSVKGIFVKNETI